MVTADLSYWKSVDGEQLFGAVAEDENVEFVLSILSTLTRDPIWTSHIIRQVRSGKLETRCMLSWIARELQPKTYVEVGVRRGFSMAVVAARCPSVEIYGFDLWVRHYAGVTNPGPEFVRSELRKVGYKKNPQFTSGSSHDTLPPFLEATSSIDLITIDGDHSLLGAYQDLIDLMPCCAVGGAVVFDDIAPDESADPTALSFDRSVDPHAWGNLLGVWHAIQAKFPNFRYFDYVRHPPGVGIAIRLF